jgi:predicted nucleotidyltransferase
VGKDIQNIVDAIVKSDRPRSVIIFGSRGRGDALEDSDVDMAILYDHLDRNPFEVARSLRMNLLDVTTLSIDLLVYEFSDFERRARHPSSIEHMIAAEGSRAYG